MSSTLKVITNSLGTGDWVVVYETNCGEVVYEGHSVSPYHLYQILKGTNGMCDDVTYHELTDEQIEDWQEHT